MIHPLLRLVASQPQLLAEHAEAYAGLLGEELGKATAAWKQRALLVSAALCLAGVAAVLGGIALMLWAVFPDATAQALWALIATPAVPALLAMSCALLARGEQADAFSDLRQQISADLLLMREVSP